MRRHISKKDTNLGLSIRWQQWVKWKNMKSLTSKMRTLQIFITITFYVSYLPTDKVQKTLWYMQARHVHLSHLHWSKFSWFHCWAKLNDMVLKNTQHSYTSKIQLRNHDYYRYTYTHPFNGPFLGLPRWAGTRKVKPIWILLKKETVSSSGISRVICKSGHRSRQITMQVPHHSVFCRPDALPAAQPTASKHWRHYIGTHTSQ